MPPVIVGNGEISGRAASAGVASAITLRDRGTGGYGRIITRVVEVNRRHRLPENRFQLPEVVIGDVDFFFELIELRVAENLPPLALQHTVARRGGLPLIAAGEFAERGGSLYRGPLILLRYGTRRAKEGNQNCEMRAAHQLVSTPCQPTGDKDVRPMLSGRAAES